MQSQIAVDQMPEWSTHLLRMRGIWCEQRSQASSSSNVNVENFTDVLSDRGGAPAAPGAGVSASAARV